MRPYAFRSPEGKLLKIEVVDGEPVKVHWVEIPYSDKCTIEVPWERIALRDYVPGICNETFTTGYSCGRIKGHAGCHEYKSGEYFVRWPPAESRCGAAKWTGSLSISNPNYVFCQKPKDHSGQHQCGAWSWP